MERAEPQSQRSDWYQLALSGRPVTPKDGATVQVTGSRKGFNVRLVLSPRQWATLLALLTTHVYWLPPACQKLLNIVRSLGVL